METPNANCATFSLEDFQHALGEPHFIETACALEGAAAVVIMTEAQKFLDRSSNEPSRNAAFKILNFLTRKTKLFVEIEQFSESEFALSEGSDIGSGGFSDIIKYTLHDKVLAVKKFSVHPSENGDVTAKRLRTIQTEILVARQLSGRQENIIPLLGIVPDRVNSSYSMVLPFMQNGDILGYAKKHPEVDRLALITQVLSGLHFMHTHTPVFAHGDLKCANILINDHGEACLSDFGAARARFGGASLSTTHLFEGTLRWAAPELIYPSEETARDEDNDPKPTPQSDIWSFGMTTLELITEQPPYFDIKNDSVVMQELSVRNSPELVHNQESLSRGLTPQIRTVLLQCWRRLPEKRPSAAQLAERVARIITRENKNH